MAARSLSALLILACASASWAQDDALLPTHLVEGGQVHVTGAFRASGGSGDASILGTDGKFDQSSYQFFVSGGVGLGKGFEIAAAVIGQFSGGTQADFSSVATEFETQAKGISDLFVEARYRILKDDTALPQLIFGAILVAPVGCDHNGQPEIKTGGVTTQKLKESGLGQGVWSYGFEAGLSKNLIVVEPYLLTSYVIGGRRTENGVHEDRADVWNLTVGAHWYITPQATIDTRAVFTRAGEDEKETNGTLVTEEMHVTSSGQAALYVKLGGGLTLIVGGGVSFPQDHELNDIIQLDLKDDMVWFVNLGLHLLLGGGK